MATASFPNGFGVPLTQLGGEIHPSVTSNVNDAVGESVAMIGQVFLTSGPGTSATISSSGGKIHWVSAAVTWATASSTLRVGIQDVDATTGIEDTTFDVYKDLVAGTDTINANAVQTTAMANGSKTISHGDIIAVVFELTARAGADSMRVLVTSRSMSRPYCTADTGSGPTKVTQGPLVAIEFDNGVVGHFGTPYIAWQADTVAVNSGSTPDEYAMIFQVPAAMVVTSLIASIGETDTAEPGEVILYSDPLGTPVAERTVTYDADIMGLPGGAVGPFVGQITAYTLQANTNYAVAWRPTSTNDSLLSRWLYPAAVCRLASPFGSTVQGGTRTNQTGAFGSLSTTSIANMGVVVSGIDTGSGGVNLAARGSGVGSLG